MIGILTARGDADPPCRELMAAAEKRGGGRYVDPIRLRLDVSDGRCRPAYDPPSPECDALILRGLNHDGDVDLQFEILEMLEAAGHILINPVRALSLAESKPHTLCLLQRAGLPVPGTIVCQTQEVVREAVRQLGDAVVKPPYGALGLGVERLAPNDVEARAGAYLKEWGSVCVQEYIPSGGQDIRVFVVGGEVLGAVQRVAQNGEWRTNVHQGGVCRSYAPSAYERELALRATSLIGLEYTGVDILPGPDGPVLLEVNGAPQWHGLASATGIAVAEAVVDRALELARRRQSVPV
ncbi:MAG: RimK family alpha-L-glutamate ligase [Armatimonadetes bacterium]|nr:RimK family alpha-L-glutamate ligase [Armatimonadota bacterium]